MTDPGQPSGRDAERAVGASGRFGGSPSFDSPSPDTISCQEMGLRYLWVVNPTPPLAEEQVVGKTDFDLILPEEVGAVATTNRRVLETGESAEFDTRIVIGGQDRRYSNPFLQGEMRRAG